MYKVAFTQRALRDWENVDKDMKVRIAKKLKEYASDPLRYAIKLTDSKIGTYRFRIGNYRIIFDIEDNNIVILRVGLRRSVYKR
jgi:mRNA interferase RelE/StbE